MKKKVIQLASSRQKYLVDTDPIMIVQLILRTVTFLAALRQMMINERGLLFGIDRQIERPHFFAINKTLTRLCERQ